MSRHLVRLALPVLALLSVGCGGAPSIIGTVLDEQGAPVAGAEVNTTPPTDFRKTNPDGKFVIQGVLGADAQPEPLPPGTYVLEVTRLPDFEGTELTVVVEGPTEVTVRLRAKTADTGEPVAPEPVPERPVDPDDPRPPAGGV